MKTATERRAIKNAMSRTVLQTVHTAGCELLPDRSILLDRMPKHGLAAEIGVAFGDYTREIMARTAPSRLFLIDAWATDRYRDGLENIRSEWADAISCGKIVIEQGLSTEVLARLPANTFDWVYIDTNHTYETTLEELELCSGLVKRNGLIAGHDFCTGNVIDAVPYGVIEAVMELDWAMLSGSSGEKDLG